MAKYILTPEEVGKAMLEYVKIYRGYQQPSDKTVKIEWRASMIDSSVTVTIEEG